MATHEDEDPPPAPRIDPGRLRSAEVIRIVNEWFDKYYSAYEDHVDEDYVANRPVIGDDDDSMSLSTLSVLERAFGGSLDAGNLVAISELVSYKSARWVRRGTAGRQYSEGLSHSPEDLDPASGRNPDEIIRAAHHNMLKALRELEAALKKVEPFASNIGGNRPPEHIGVPPYTNEDDRHVRAAIGNLRRAPIRPDPIPLNVEDAVETIERTSLKFTEYVGTLGDISARKFAEEIGKTAAKAIVGVSVWALLGSKLMEAAQAACNWLEALRLFG